jgi:DNA recombination protein RmuC
MPGGRMIVVDCKTPLDAYLASLEAPTEELRTAELLRHGRHVKDHVKRLSSRAYLETFKDSPDFTVMFLPNESFLYAALESEPDLVEYGLQKKVLITTPPTLIGLLKVIRFGWTEEKLTQNAQRISEAGQELHKRLVDFVDSFLSIGKHIEKAKAEYEAGLSRLERRVLVQARRMETLGVKSSKSLPEGLGVIEDVNNEASDVNIEA